MFDPFIAPSGTLLGLLQRAAATARSTRLPHRAPRPSRRSTTVS